MRYNSLGRWTHVIIYFVFAINCIKIINYSKIRLLLPLVQGLEMQIMALIMREFILSYLDTPDIRQ